MRSSADLTMSVRMLLPVGMLAKRTQHQPILNRLVSELSQISEEGTATMILDGDGHVVKTDDGLDRLPRDKIIPIPLQPRPNRGSRSLWLRSMSSPTW